MRVLALIPPFLFFTYSSYLDKHLFCFDISSPGWWQKLLQKVEKTLVFYLPKDLCHIWFPIDDKNGENLLTMTLESPGELLSLCLVAMWPLLISGLYQYYKISDTLHNEIKKYRLPLIRARIVKLRYVIKAISPAFYIAIALVFVTSCTPEIMGGGTQAISGVANYYIKDGLDASRNDPLVLGVLMMTFLGLVFLGIWDMIALYVSHLRHIQFSRESKKVKRGLL
jgi:hypothetical protein